MKILDIWKFHIFALWWRDEIRRSSQLLLVQLLVSVVFLAARISWFSYVYSHYLPHQRFISIQHDAELFILQQGKCIKLAVSNRLMICQRQNHLRKWSSKHQSPWWLLPASHNLRSFNPNPLLKFFWGKQVVLEPSLHFTPVLQSSVCILPPVSALPPVCSLQTGGKVSLQLWLLTLTLTLIILDKWLWIYENNVCNNKGFDMKWTLLEYQWK